MVNAHKIVCLQSSKDRRHVTVRTNKTNTNESFKYVVNVNDVTVVHRHYTSDVLFVQCAVFNAMGLRGVNCD